MRNLRTKVERFHQGRMTFMALSPLLFISPSLMALTQVGAGENVTIVDSTPVDNYLVRNGGVLNTENAQTHEVFVQSDQPSTRQAVLL